MFLAYSISALDHNHLIMSTHAYTRSHSAPALAKLFYDWCRFAQAAILNCLD